ncbi:MAG: S53 family peptidase [Burkholderiales bacterium]|nr:S53 family peptidase [Burkholderiales bacterium]
MKTPRPPISSRSLLGAVCAAALLAACGGGAPSAPADSAAPAAVATAATTLDFASPASLQPTFHAAPLLLDEPDAADPADPMASARNAPHVQGIPSEFQALATRGLTLQALQQARRMNALSVNTGPQAVTPKVATTYTPAQIRAAYGLPALPAAGATLTAAQAAQFGAGQTIYIVDAMNDPNVAAELAAFNTRFALPACTTQAIPASTALPLAAASKTGCTFSVVYATAAGKMTATPPANDAGWATEIALDVQWAHATAPLARIVLIEAPDAGQGLLGAIALANAMGPGAVSMSFGGPESSGFTAAVDSAFTAAGMSYLAATGDSGAGVSWPAVSSHVLAVSGTSLNFSGSGTRSETVWSGSGGGISQYTATPAYQNSSVPGMGTPAHRAVADVAFNGDPGTGQYVAVIPVGSSSAGWLSVGGTSLSTPQWAGLVAIANAMRALSSKAVLGAPHAALYGQIGAVPGTYAAAFADITAGSDGGCSSCSAKTGYDTASGLGTPNAAALLSTLGGATLTAAAPVVTPAAISGQVGTALSFTVAVNAPNAVTYKLTGAPTGTTIATSGAVSWPKPMAGNYSVTVTATDTKTALSGQGVYTITIAAPTAPVVTGASVAGKVGTALSYQVKATAPNALSYSLSGAPAGMTISTAGLVAWPKPVLGSFSVTVTAKDAMTGLSGQALLAVQIAAAGSTASTGPTISAPPISGVAGKPLSGSITFSDPGVAGFSVSIKGAPLGLMITPNGMTLALTWASPVTGSYTLQIQLLDSAGRSASATLPITVNAK